MEHDKNIEALLHHVDLSPCSNEMVTLSDDNREVGVSIADYVAKKLKERFGDCCNGLLTGDGGAENPDFSHVRILSRGLTIPSTNLVNYICTAFAILEFVDDLITKSGLPVRKGAEHVLIVSGHSRHLLVPHMKQLHDKSVAADGVKIFKKRQRYKSSH